jgi:hypothetical protein
MIQRPFAAVTGLILLACSGTAAELVVRDIRASAGIRPTAFDFTLATPTLQASGTDGFDAGIGLELGGRWSFSRPGDAVGLVVGLDGMLDGYSYGGGDGLATSWLRVSAGPGWAITDRWTLTGEVGAMYGVSAIALPPTTSSTDFSATGTATGYDVRLAASWLLTRQFAIGAYAGYMMASHDLSGDAAMTVDQSGLTGGLELIWRFTDAPPRLE